MADLDTNEQLIASGVITRELVERAAQVSSTIATSYTGRLLAAGADATSLFESLAKISGIPVAPKDLVDWATPVAMLPSTARQMQEILACPVRRDAQGTLHILIAVPEAFKALDKLLIGFKVYLAPETIVRRLLQNLYSVGTPQAVGEAIEIDLEASRQNLRSPPSLEAIEIDLEQSGRMLIAPKGPAKAAPPSTSSSAPSVSSVPSSPSNSGAPSAASAISVAAKAIGVDPLAPRASGSFKRRVDDDEQTMRVQRVPRGPSAAAPQPAAPTAPVEQRALAQVKPADDDLDDAAAKAEQRAFWRGALLGASVTLVLAAIVIVALVSR